jgi:hypothetical protein
MKCHAFCSFRDFLMNGVKGCGRISIHDGLLNVAWFCVCKSGGSLAGDECKFCGGGW